MASERVVLLVAIMVYFVWIVNAKATGSMLEEPVCSKYHFEEQVLEKLVRLEFRVEQSNTAIQDELSELKEDTKALKSTQEQEIKDSNDELLETKDELKKLKAAQEKTNEEVSNLKAELDADKLAQKKELVQMKAGILAEIATTQKSQSVAFVARNPPQALSIRSIIKFSTEVLNLGHAYSSSTGQFTAPVSGTYLFSVHICPANYAGYQLIVNEIILGVSHNDEGKTTGVCSSMTTVVVMKSGEKAWVKNVNYDHSRLNADHTMTNGWNMFSGILL